MEKTVRRFDLSTKRDCLGVETKILFQATEVNSMPFITE